MTADDLSLYGQSMVADVLATAEAENATAPEVFTRRVLDELEQAGETENTFVAYHRAHGMEVSGYGGKESLGVLDVFITSFCQPPLDSRLTRTDADTLFQRLTTFLRRCLDGLHENIDESSDVHDMCLSIKDSIPDATRIRLFLLTNRISSAPALQDGDFDGKPLSYQIWDLTRLYRVATSGSLSEPVDVTFDPPLPCLKSSAAGPDYSILLTILPGPLLSRLYGRYGSRLLELNVRSFLQARGSVNSGIRNTLLTEPDRFLAYNNGISATAAGVDLVDGGTAIQCIHDLQIVNGGQTTASLHHAALRDKADITQVQVQMKLTVVTAERLHQVVPEISKYSNMQNKVTIVDFSSNHPYHVALEKTTRSIWAPAIDGGGQETRWFYERARGQYADALARERTPAAQRRFRTVNPPGQKFSKSDVAKYVHSWNQFPYLVSRGAEKNFREFTIRLDENPPAVDYRYCTQLLAAAILFKRTDQIVHRRNFGGHKNVIVPYTVSRLSHATEKQVDLDEIWRNQGLSETLTAAIDDLCVRVHSVIMRPLRGSNIGEWAKRPECWDQVLQIAWRIPPALKLELSPGSASEDSGDADIAAVSKISAVDWFTLARWAKETGSLRPWQRQLAFTVGTLVRHGAAPNEKQASQALSALEEACRLGFRTASI